MPSAPRVALLSLVVGAGFCAVPCVLAATHLVSVPRDLYLLLALQGTLFVGTLAGQRLAWQLGRPLALAAAAYAAVFGRVAVEAAGAPPDASSASEWSMTVVAVLFVVTAAALAMRDAKKWFRLECPSCDGLASGASDVLYRYARCDRCGLRW